MKLLAQLVTDLDQLTDVLEDPNTDLVHLTREFASSISDAVSAVVSVKLTVLVDGNLFEVSAASNEMDGSAGVTIASSLRIDLAGHPHVRKGASVLILSAAAGSLVDFAADVSFVLRADLSAIELDAHVGQINDERTAADNVVRSMGELREINQAIGVLIECRRTPDEARVELAKLAVKLDSPLVVVARRVLADALGWHPPRYRRVGDSSRGAVPPSDSQRC